MDNKRKRLFLIATATLIVAEAIARFLPPLQLASNIVYHPTLGHTGPANTTVHFPNLEIHYNRYGFRDTLDTTKDPKILFLGDSITEGVAVPFSDTYPQKTAKFLNTTVMAFASSDYGTLQELLAYRLYGGDLNPRVVALQFVGINDFVNNNFLFAEKNQSANDAWRPYLLAGTPDFSPVYPHPWLKWLREHSRLVQRLEIFVLQKTVLKNKAQDKSLGCTIAKQLFVDNQDPYWRDAFRATRKNAEIYNALAVASPKRHFFAFYVPSNIELIDIAWVKAVYESLENCYPDDRIDRHRGEKIFLKLFQQPNVHAFSLWPEFATVKNKEALYDQTGHLSIEGHRMAAKIVAEKIKGYLRKRNETP